MTGRNMPVFTMRYNYVHTLKCILAIIKKIYFIVCGGSRKLP